MIQLPESTYIGKKIPKEGFYSNLTLNAAVKRAFVDDVEHIIWRNVLSAATLNVGKGERVNQIDLIQINLKRQEVSAALLELIEKAIPRYLIFLLRFGDVYQLRVNYKEPSKQGKLKIIDSYTTDWMPESALNIAVKGLDLDQVYENLVMQIAGSKLIKIEGAKLKESVQHAQEKQKIEKKIEELELKLRTEKQFNIQLRISDEIKQFRKKLVNLTGKTE